MLRSNGYVSNARRQRLTVGELSLSRPEEFAQDFDERMSKEAEMISQQPIVLNGPRRCTRARTRRAGCSTAASPPAASCSAGAPSSRDGCGGVECRRLCAQTLRRGVRAIMLDYNAECWVRRKRIH